MRKVEIQKSEIRVGGKKIPLLRGGALLAVESELLERCFGRVSVKWASRRYRPMCRGAIMNTGGDSLILPARPIRPVISGGSSG